jgi:CheY-like chemotaxis protein
MRGFFYLQNYFSKNLFISNNCFNFGVPDQNPMKNTTNIFLIDDDDDDRQIFCEVIREINNKIIITEARDGHEALKMLIDNYFTPPQLIFLDLNMPIMGGLECLNFIKRNSKYKDTPVIIYSTASDEYFIDKAYSGGANLYISKPCFVRDLYKIIEKVFNLPPEKYLPQPPRRKFFMTA